MWSRRTGSSNRGDEFDMANNTRRAVFGKIAMSAPEPSLPRNPQCNHDQLYGADRTVHHEVTAADSIQRTGNRSAKLPHKPRIAASTRLLELCKWPCIDAVRETIKPNEYILDAHHRLEYRAPIPIGASLVITARCTVSNHPYSEWEVNVHNGHGDVGHATVAFIVVDRAELEQEGAKPKHRLRNRWFSREKHDE